LRSRSLYFSKCFVIACWLRTDLHRLLKMWKKSVISEKKLSFASFVAGAWSAGGGVQGFVRGVGRRTRLEGVIVCA